MKKISKKQLKQIVAGTTAGSVKFKTGKALDETTTSN